jgi:hypothetical protein
MRTRSHVVAALLVPSFFAALAARADDGPKVSWQGAGAKHYTSGRSSKIDRIVIHTVEGSQESAVETFRAGARHVSAHYVVGDDGSIVQCVKDEDTAHHAKGVNARSIGIEHAGYADRMGTWTRAKYEASARLARSLCDRHGIPIDREHIVGHVEVPGSTHHDPGEFFDWDLYMKLIRGETATVTSPDGTAATTSDALSLEDQLPLPSLFARKARREKAAEEARLDGAHEARRSVPAGEAKPVSPGRGMTGSLGRASGSP